MGDHDQLFKRAFRLPANAAGELRSVLPESLCEVIDFDSLSLVSSEPTDKKLGPRSTDLLFQATFRSGQPVSSSTDVSAPDVVLGFIWLLLEHQSTVDQVMPIRVLEYFARTWSELLRETPTRKSFPPIICVVVHHSDTGWTAPTRLHDLIEGIDHLPHLRQLVPDFRIVVDDLSHQSDADLQRRPLPLFPQLALWVLRDARTIQRLFEHLHAWAQQFAALADQSPDDFFTLMRYIWGVSSDASATDIHNKILEVVPSTEKAMATAAEQLIQEGIRRGKAEGKAEGVLAILEARQLALSSAQREQVLACKDVAQLDRWLRQAVTAASALELFPH